MADTGRRPWRDVPECYGSWAAVYALFRRWQRDGTSPVTVINYGVAMGGKGSKRNLFVTNPPDWATRLPAAVEPGGESARLLVPVAELNGITRTAAYPSARCARGPTWVTVAGSTPQRRYR
ncbi:hypothetical protein Vlu01_51400 [Micromonospora lutea]|uniref:Insertion element IS402-like domain-containing protein n=1 Tax=Micromonospora lutea TaxID=419825 RepID=A0ABQ4J3A5_9ACTN|nr:hypothetical protein Vlu01_51400 [Micromonospora lutea]